MGQISDSLLFIIIIQRFICLKAREGEKQREKGLERDRKILPATGLLTKWL